LELILTYSPDSVLRVRRSLTLGCDP